MPRRRYRREVDPVDLITALLQGGVGVGETILAQKKQQKIDEEKLNENLREQSIRDMFANLPEFKAQPDLSQLAKAGAPVPYLAPLLGARKDQNESIGGQRGLDVAEGIGPSVQREVMQEQYPQATPDMIEDMVKQAFFPDDNAIAVQGRQALNDAQQLANTQGSREFTLERDKAKAAERQSRIEQILGKREDVMALPEPDRPAAAYKAGLPSPPGPEKPEADLMKGARTEYKAAQEAKLSSPERMEQYAVQAIHDLDPSGVYSKLLDPSQGRTASYLLSWWDGSATLKPFAKSVRERIDILRKFDLESLDSDVYKMYPLPGSDGAVRDSAAVDAMAEKIRKAEADIAKMRQLMNMEDGYDLEDSIDQ